jgi:hypothetical protein
MGGLLDWDTLRGILVMVVILLIFSGRGFQIVSGLLKKAVKRYGG